jgi:hypothetical protein
VNLSIFHWSINFVSLTGLKRARVESSDDEGPDPTKEPEALTMKQRSRDIDEFFDKPCKAPGDSKPKRECIICKYVVYCIFLLVAKSKSPAAEESDWL